jgi:hypothetical protein
LKQQPHDDVALCKASAMPYFECKVVVYVIEYYIQRARAFLTSPHVILMSCRHSVCSHALVYVRALLRVHAVTIAVAAYPVFYAS